MSEVRYGHVDGPGHGREVSLSTVVYYHRLGGKFVYLNQARASVCASGYNAPAGWLEISKSDSGKNGWTPVSGDKAFMIYADAENEFELPVKENVASLAASQIGLCFRIVNSGATYATKQYAVVGNTTASPLLVTDVDTDNKTVRVKVHPLYRQK